MSKKLSLLTCTQVLFLLALCHGLISATPPGEKNTNLSGWPLVRGNPLQTGVARKSLPEKMDILWRFKGEDAFEGPAAIADGIVYVGCYDEYLYAIGLADGKLKWKYKAGPIKAAPSVHQGAVFVGDETGIFHCVEARTGTKRWTFETKGEITASANFYQDRIIIGSYDSSLYCLSSEGKKIWEIKTEGPVNGSPAVVDHFTFVAGCDSILHKIDIKTGKQVGSVELGGQAAATAAIQGKVLFVGTMSNQVLGIDWDKGKILWTFEPKRRAQAFFSSAAIANGLVVVGSRDRKVYGLESKTGKEVWSFPTGGRVDPSPVIAGTRVFAPSQDGKLYVLDLKTGKELQNYPLGRSILASPAVSNGRLVLGTTDGVLYCLGQKE